MEAPLVPWRQNRYGPERAKACRARMPPDGVIRNLSGAKRAGFLKENRQRAPAFLIQKGPRGAGGRERYPCAGTKQAAVLLTQGVDQYPGGLPGTRPTMQTDMTGNRPRFIQTRVYVGPFPLPGTVRLMA